MPYIVTWESLAFAPPRPPYRLPTGWAEEVEAELPARPVAGPQPEAVSSPEAGRLRGPREVATDSTSQAFPFTQGAGGQTQYWPFSAADIYNWKQHDSLPPPFSKDLMALNDLIESVLMLFALFGRSVSSGLLFSCHPI